MLALDRMFHQPIRRKDMIPTPSHPTKSWYMLLAVMIISIAIRKVVKYLINLLILGSDDIYHVENSVMDHVMNNAIGINTTDSESMVKLM